MSRHPCECETLLRSESKKPAELEKSRSLAATATAAVHGATNFSPLCCPQALPLDMTGQERLCISKLLRIWRATTSCHHLTRAVEYALFLVSALLTTVSRHNHPFPGFIGPVRAQTASSSSSQ